jgi:uncharacterized membrane protein
MQARHAPWIVFLLLCLVLVGLTAYHLPMLPDRLATHFDTSGRGNGWMSQAGFIKFVAAVLVGLGIIFLGAGLIGRVITALAPGRTLVFVRDGMRWVVTLLLSLFVLSIAMVLRANLAAPPQLPQYVPWAGLQTRNQLLVLSGVLAIIAIPLLLKIVPPNPFYGFRTRLTRADPDVWYRVNAFFGWWLLVTSCASAIVLAVGPDNLLTQPPVAIAVVFLPLLCVVILGVVYSRRLVSHGQGNPFL